MKIKNKKSTILLSHMNKIVPTYFRTNILDLISLYYLCNINWCDIKKNYMSKKVYI